MGGDRLGGIKEKLNKNGFESIGHISGRKSSDKKVKIPQDTDLILVLVDYVGHSLTESIKKESKRNGIKVAFSKRSWVHMEKVIQGFVNETSKNGYKRSNIREY